MIRIVSIKFRSAGKRYDFDAQDLILAPDDRVIVETDRGRALGIVISSPREVQGAERPDTLKTVLRLATDEDLALASTNSAREDEAFQFCLERIAFRKMEMKLVRAEYLFDGSKIIFYFTADGRVDFRELVKDLAHHFHTRIEMRQIGVRDEAKLTGGLGICGRELCCCTFLTDFNPVSVKMAKEQGLALNPNKISGQCGRLLCCLGYEFETYCSMKKNLPKCGRTVQVEGAAGEVIDQNVLTQQVTVRMGSGQRVQVPVDQIEKGRRTEPPAGSDKPPAQKKEERPRRKSGGRGGSAQPKPADRPAREQRPAEKPQQREKPQPAADKLQHPEENPVQPTNDPSGKPSEGKRRNRRRRRPRRK